MPWFLNVLVMSFIISIIPYCYIGWRLVKAFNIVFPGFSGWFRIFIPVALFLVNLLPFVILISHSGDNFDKLFLFSNNLQTADYLINYPFWIFQIIIVEIIFYFLVFDLVHIYLKKRKSGGSKKHFKRLAILKVSFFLFFLVYVPCKVYIDTNTIKITNYTVEIKKLPEQFQELRLTLTGDLQIDRYTQEKKITDFLNQIKKTDPDLIFFAGDIVTSGGFFITKAVQALCNSQAKLSRIACLGDHDLWSDSSKIASGLKKCGWEFLDNKHHIITYKDKRILITGITYVYDERIPGQKLNRILSAAPEVDLKILLVHQPAFIVKQAAQKYGYNLLLAGHTHGGQVVFRPFGIPLTPTKIENPVYTGDHKQGDLNIIVTNGIGLTMWPIRYQAPGEIVKIKLTKDRL